MEKYQDQEKEEFEQEEISDLFDPEADESEMSSIDILLKQINNLPKKRTLMCNMPRYIEVMKSVKKIAIAINAGSPDAISEVNMDELTGTSLCLTIVADELNIYDIQKFRDGIELANTIDIIPKVDGKVEIGICFERVLIPVPPNEKN